MRLAVTLASSPTHCRISDAVIRGYLKAESVNRFMQIHRLAILHGNSLIYAHYIRFWRRTYTYT